MSSPSAVFVVAPATTPNGQVVLAATTRTDGSIGLPGGKLEFLESPQAAAIREALEEGFRVDSVDPNPVHCAIVDGKVVWWLLGYGVTRLTDYPEKPRGIEPLWVPVEDLSPGLGNEFLRDREFALRHHAEENGVVDDV